VAKFEIRPVNGGWTWVVTSQGRTLASGETYARRAQAEKAVVSFRTAAVNAPVIDTTIPAAKTATGKAARATGRVLGKAVVKSGRAVEKVEKTAAGAAKKTVAKAKATGK
jgi:uncharacterized protein YegP (UPF0339 family)